MLLDPSSSSRTATADSDRCDPRQQAVKHGRHGAHGRHGRYSRLLLLTANRAMDACLAARTPLSMRMAWRWCGWAGEVSNSMSASSTNVACSLKKSWKSSLGPSPSWPGCTRARMSFEPELTAEPREERLRPDSLRRSSARLPFFSMPRSLSVQMFPASIAASLDVRTMTSFEDSLRLRPRRGLAPAPAPTPAPAPAAAPELRPNPEPLRVREWPLPPGVPALLLSRDAGRGSSASE